MQREIGKNVHQDNQNTITQVPQKRVFRVIIDG